MKSKVQPTHLSVISSREALQYLKPGGPHTDIKIEVPQEPEEGSQFMEALPLCSTRQAIILKIKGSLRLKAQI
jgi:hypothetical protein